VGGVGSAADEDDPYVSDLLAAARGVWWRNARNFFGNPAFIVPGTLFPLFFFTAFAGGLSRIDGVPGFGFEPGYTAWIYGFVLMQAAAFGGIFTGFSVARDFESGFSRRLLLASRRRSGIVLGYLLAALTRAVFVISVVTTVALLSGMNLHASAGDLVAMYALAFVVNAAAALFGMGVAMRLRTMQAGPAMQTPAFLLLFLSPVWVPFDLLTGWVKAVASVNPVTVLLEAERGFISGNPTKESLAFLLAAGLAALFVAWALRGLRSAERAA
jgi:ABC-type multidrug transport system permease subunit